MNRGHHHQFVNSQIKVSIFLLARERLSIISFVGIKSSYSSIYLCWSVVRIVRDMFECSQRYVGVQPEIC